MRHSRLAKIGAVSAICVVAGAAWGIAGSAAAPSKSKKAEKAQDYGGRGGGPGGPGHGIGIGIGAGGPPVHSEAVVPNQAGTGFDTVTMDNGKFKSLSGNQLTITEGTDKAVYKDVTITVPDGSKVYRNHDAAQLSDLKDGDQVRVAQAPSGTFVAAEDAATQQSERDHWGKGGPGHGPGAPAAPPPPATP
jgi:hypothetical protein